MRRTDPLRRTYAYVNGKVTPASRAVIPVFDRGLVLGDGLFETLRVREGRPEFLDLHYRRWTQSARRLRLRVPVSETELRGILARLCRKSRLDDAVARITLTRGLYLGGLSIDPKIPPTLIVTVTPVSETPSALYERGVKVAISGINKAAASGLDPGIKSTNYLANIFAKAEADKKRLLRGNPARAARRDRGAFDIEFFLRARRRGHDAAHRHGHSAGHHAAGAAA